MKLEDIPQKRKLKALRKKDSLYSFYEKVERAVSLVNYAENSKSNKIRSEARKQFFIALVTALEVYLTDLVSVLINKDRKIKNKLNDLSDRKFSLQEVYFIKRKNISLGELVILYNNFQDLDNIRRIFNNILGINLFECIKENKFYYQDTRGREQSFVVRSDIYRRLERVLNTRHNYVHEVIFRNTPSYSELEKARSAITTFVHCIEIVSNKITENRINRYEKK